MEVGGGQPHWPPRPDASPHPRRGRRRGRVLFVLSRGRRRARVLRRRVLTQNGDVPRTRVRARFARSVFPTRSKGGRPRRPPRTETRGARDRRPRRHGRPRCRRGEPPRCLPAHCQNHLDAPRAGELAKMWVGRWNTQNRSVRFSSASRPVLLLPRAGGPSDPAQRQHQVKHRTAFYVVVLRGPVVVHLLSAEDQSGGGEGEGRESRATKT